MLDLDQLLRHAVDHGASDVHMKVGSPPYIRVDGHLDEAPFDTMTPADTERVAFAIMPPARAEEFHTSNEADFAHAVAGLGRFRVNVFRQRGSVGIVMRRVLAGIPSLSELGMPPVLERLASEPRGLVLVTGPTGSGKTTTLGAAIDYINEHYRRHVVTIEDPIEVLHPDKKSIINQREVGTDTEDFHSALKRVLRQDPDVILIGEMRDPETVHAALSAAETGHLVFSTLHTIGAKETVDRVIEFFPPHQQQQIRHTLASSLRGLVSQRLLERRDGTGRVPAVEVCVNTGRVFDKIVNADQTHELEVIIADGEYYGMQTFDQSILQLFKNDLVTLRDALAIATHPHDLRLAIEQAGLIEGSMARERTTA